MVIAGKDNDVHAEAFELLRLLARQEGLGGTILSGLRPLLQNPPQSARASGGVMGGRSPSGGDDDDDDDDRDYGGVDDAGDRGGGGGVGGQTTRARLARAAEVRTPQECALSPLVRSF